MVAGARCDVDSTRLAIKSRSAAATFEGIGRRCADASLGGIASRWGRIALKAAPQERARSSSSEITATLPSQLEIDQALLDNHSSPSSIIPRDAQRAIGPIIRDVIPIRESSPAHRIPCEVVCERPAPRWRGRRWRPWRTWRWHGGRRDRRLAPDRGDWLRFVILTGCGIRGWWRTRSDHR